MHFSLKTHKRDVTYTYTERMKKLKQSAYRRIQLVAGAGSGKTSLAAFDAALVACGLGDYNLIRLSSVLPPFARVVTSEKWQASAGDWGHKLYVVYAYGVAKSPGTEVWAGVGWIVVDENTGAGLFVEHSAESRQQCEQLIHDTLTGLCINRGLDPTAFKQHTKFSKAAYVDEPAGALVAAVFKSEGWA